MVRRERLEARGEVADLGRRMAHAEAPTVLLKHIDPRTAIGRVNHHIEGASRLEDVAQGLEPRIGVGQVVQDAGADDVVEALAEFGGALQSELAHLEVGERVLALQPLRERDAFGADVDPDDLGAGPAQRIMRGLGGPAAGDQYAPVVAVGLRRPEEMGVGASAPVVPSLTVGVQVVDGRRVGMMLVKGAHLPGDGGGGRGGTFTVVHDWLKPFPTGLIQLGGDRKALMQALSALLIAKPAPTVAGRTLAARRPVHGRVPCTGRLDPGGGDRTPLLPVSETRRLSRGAASPAPAPRPG